MTNNTLKAANRFKADTTNHEMTIFLDQGVYRHIRFRNPSTIMYWFELITTPGTLIVRGDMGSWVFVRIEDMFEFFGGDRDINPHYWAEKLTAIDRNTTIKQFDPTAFRTFVIEDFAERRHDYTPKEAQHIWSAIRADLLRTNNWPAPIETTDEAITALAEFDATHGIDYEYSDPWDHNFEDYTERYLWICHAIQWGIRTYRDKELADLLRDHGIAGSDIEQALSAAKKLARAGELADKPAAEIVARVVATFDLSDLAPAAAVLARGSGD